MRKVSFIFSLFTFTVFAQQTPQYTQFMFEKNFYNPAYIGISPNSIEGALSTKTYLYSFNPDASYVSNDVLQSLNKPVIYTAALHGSSKKRNMAMGMRLQLDKQPILSNTYVTGYVSKRKKIGFNKMLSLGIEIGLRNTSINQNNLKLITQDDAALKNDNSAPFNFIEPDLGVGTYFSAKKYYWGLSVKNLTSFKYSWSQNFKKSVGARNYPHIFATAGYTQPLSNKFTLQGNLLYKMVLSNLFYSKSLKSNTRDNSVANLLYNDLSLLDLNAILEYNKTFAVGGTYRTNKTVAAIIRLRLADRVYFSYAYDIPMASRNTSSFKGNHEILINYLVDFGKFAEKTIDPRYY